MYGWALGPVGPAWTGLPNPIFHGGKSTPLPLPEPGGTVVFRTLLQRNWPVLGTSVVEIWIFVALDFPRCTGVTATFAGFRSNKQLDRTWKKTQRKPLPYQLKLMMMTLLCVAYLFICQVDSWNSRHPELIPSETFHGSKYMYCIWRELEKSGVLYCNFE